MPEVEFEPLTLQQNPVEVRPLKRITGVWTYLPYELWLIVLVDYGLTAKDLLHLDFSCKWFSTSWRGTSKKNNNFFCNSRHELGMRIRIYSLFRFFSDRRKCSPDYKEKKERDFWRLDQ